MMRQSLCCGREGCRKRLLPPSCIYMGRKKYWSGIIFVIMALRQNRSNSKMTIKVMRMFGISYNTLLRWRAWFKDEFAGSDQWKKIRGRISACVSSRQLPASLLNYFIQTLGSDEQGLIGCLQILASG
jgi:hypothetical protein